MIDTETLREWVLGDATDASQDTVLEILEAEAVAYVEAVTGRYFGAPAERVEYLTGSGHDLWLNELPRVAAETPLVVEAWNGEAWEETDSADYTLYPISERDGARIHYPTGWRTPTRVRVTYTAGYAEGTEPDLIRSAVLYRVSERYNLKGMEGKLSESVGGYQVSLTSKITERGALSDMLAPWKRPVVA